MRWPVSRARYDLLEHNSRELIAQIKADLAVAEGAQQDWAEIAKNARKDAADWQGLFDNERQRYDTLLQTTLALKVQGATVVPVAGGVVEPPAPVPTPKPDELKELIYNKAGTNYPMRAMMLRQLSADRAAGLTDDEIRSQIATGISSDGVPA